MFKPIKIQYLNSIISKMSHNYKKKIQLLLYLIKIFCIL